jgi:hypothetical protein
MVSPFFFFFILVLFRPFAFLTHTDVILQDFCAVVGTDKLATSSFIPHKRQWFRNVFTEPVGSLGECADVTAPLVSRGSSCLAIPGTLVDANKPGGSTDNNTHTDGTVVGNGGTEQASSSTLVSFVAAIALVLVSTGASLTMM